MSDDIIRSVDFRNKINTQSLEILRDLGDGDRLVLEIILQMQKNDALHLEILRSLSEGPQRLEQSVSDEVEVEVESSSSLSGSLDELEDVAEGEYEAPFLEQLSAIVESLDGMLDDDVYEELKGDLTQTPPTYLVYWIKKLQGEGDAGQPEVARKLALLCAGHIQDVGEYSDQNDVACALYEIGLTDRALELVTELRTRWSGEGFGEELNNLFGSICSSQSDAEHSFMTPDALREFGQDILTRFDDFDIVLSVFESVRYQTEDEDWAQQMAQAIQIKLADIDEFRLHMRFFQAWRGTKMELQAPVEEQFGQLLVERLLDRFFEEEEAAPTYHFIDFWRADVMELNISPTQVMDLFDIALDQIHEADIGYRRDLGEVVNEIKESGRLDTQWCDAFIERIYDQMVNNLEEHAPDGYFNDVLNFCRNQLGDDHRAAQLFYRFESEMRAEAEEYGIDDPFDWLDELSDAGEKKLDFDRPSAPFVYIARLTGCYLEDMLSEWYGEDQDGWPEEFRSDNSAQAIPTSFAHYLSELLSDFVECVSIRVEDTKPCFLRINREDGSFFPIRLNPEPAVEGTTYAVSKKIRKELAESLSKFSIAVFEDPDIQVAIISDRSNHWDHNFLKLSECFGDEGIHYFSMYGWHEASCTYGEQSYAHGDYDTGIENVGVVDSYNALKTFTLQDFSVATYLNRED